ncbi:hypothetical protein [Chengkuizengella axinellae]|uniref:Uncharacterized protein n=1 Tax=Chengkuizengella axinellae TaxID=3064388 RepID=A0ABT9J0R9_9BACL|nr:hypothetical protein [Chengkuizengella sp. 2205SS18-9]MDP5275012.1 hypothetical protein [Chengkuizengella sp. 2205SS18-9]
MGKFDRTKCDCCVCPMQSVMQQLGDSNRNDVGIATPVGVDGDIMINSAEGFIARTNNGSYPICNVTAVGVGAPPFDFTVKPLKKDVKGECSCCEDPATNELNLLIGEVVDIEFVGGVAPFADGDIVTGTVTKVGEGILFLSDLGTLSSAAISTCQITRIELSTS